MGDSDAQLLEASSGGRDRPMPGLYCTSHEGSGGGRCERERARGSEGVDGGVHMGRGREEEARGRGERERGGEKERGEEHSSVHGTQYHRVLATPSWQ